LRLTPFPYTTLFRSLCVFCSYHFYHKEMQGIYCIKVIIKKMKKISLLALFIAFSCLHAAARQKKDPPTNIIFILADDHRYDAMGDRKSTRLNSSHVK